MQCVPTFFLVNTIDHKLLKFPESFLVKIFSFFSDEVMEQEEAENVPTNEFFFGVNKILQLYFLGCGCRHVFSFIHRYGIAYSNGHVCSLGDW